MAQGKRWRDQCAPLYRLYESRDLHNGTAERHIDKGSVYQVRSTGMVEYKVGDRFSISLFSQSQLNE